LTNLSTKSSPLATKSKREPIARGLEFLVRARDAEGWWRDFETLAGESDEWVSAFAAWAIAPLPEGRRLAEDTFGLLAFRERDEGWGYRAGVPADCDSTAWVCRLAARLGRSCEPGVAALRRSRRENGGMPTYRAAGPIRRFTGLPHTMPFHGWTSPHVCVSANALAVLSGDAALRRFVENAREPDGGWSGYWWPDRAYPTWLAATALGWDARAWAEACPESSAFSLACRVAVGAESAVEPLLALQADDGGWPASARLRIPAPGAIDPAGALESLDRNRVYTTAMALGALRGTL
jgi:hypothetical protein